MKYRSNNYKWKYKSLHELTTLKSSSEYPSIGSREPSSSMILPFNPLSIINSPSYSNEFAMSMFSTVLPLPPINTAVWPLKDPDAMVLSSHPVSLIPGPTRLHISPLPMVLALIPVALVPGQISKRQYPIPMCISILPPPLIFGPISVLNNALISWVPLMHAAFIPGSVWEHYKTIVVFVILGLLGDQMALAPLGAFDLGVWVLFGLFFD